MKTKFSGVEATPFKWEGSRPTKKDIVKNPARQPSQLGYETWSKSRPGKASITGKGQK